ncbi:MAG: M20/M25/M40 family metallo-hydrolase [Solirubrobacterales bacterium]
MSAWAPADEHLLLELLGVDTTTPMETGRPSALRDAQCLLAEHAVAAGFEIEHFAPPERGAIERPGVPLPVLERAAEMGKVFLSSQPNLVLRLGPPRPSDRTLVFNSHLDTVGGDVEVTVNESTLTGRGAIDAKGPVVAVLAGVRDAVATRPDLRDRITVLLHAVGGEEGGALGVYGTREMAERGYLGRLNVVAEASQLGFFDHGTVSMTTRIAVDGAGSTDDEPALGDNATLILASVVCDLAELVGPSVEEIGAKMCIAGMSTGSTHDRVFGSGHLLLNFSYGSQEQGSSIERHVEAAFEQVADRFASRFGQLAIAKRSALRLTDVCSLTWLKRGLPVLRNRDEEMESLLGAVGISRHDPDGDPAPFTCDAMWLAGSVGHTIVFGPGDLGANGAHTPREHVFRTDLEEYAERVSALVLAFDRKIG